jgi:hypothetical protein
MRKQVGRAVVAAVLAFGLAGSLAWAGNAVVVNIPFSFMVKDKELPAGRYEFRVESTDNNRLAIRNVDSAGPFMLDVLTRLADVGDTKLRVVFDKTADGKSYLSEVHMPGRDGFLVGISKGREQHVIVTGRE